MLVAAALRLIWPPAVRDTCLTQVAHLFISHSSVSPLCAKSRKTSTVDSREGAGTITLLDSGSFRGDSAFLGWSQEQLASLYQSLNPP